MCTILSGCSRQHDLIRRRLMVMAAQHAELEAAVNLAQAASESLKQRLDGLIDLLSDEQPAAQEGTSRD